MSTTPVIARNLQIEPLIIHSVEGQSLQGTWIKQLLRGNHGLLLEVHVQEGTSIPEHAHHHESFCYIISGRVEVTIGDETHQLGPGDAFLHPIAVPHRTRVLADTVWIELKSPPEKTW